MNETYRVVTAFFALIGLLFTGLIIASWAQVKTPSSQSNWPASTVGNLYGYQMSIKCGPEAPAACYGVTEKEVVMVSILSKIGREITASGLNFKGACDKNPKANCQEVVVETPDGVKHEYKTFFDFATAMGVGDFFKPNLTP